jgi:hypothetical protein
VYDFVGGSGHVYVGQVNNLTELGAYIFEENVVYNFYFPDGLEGYMPSGNYSGEYIYEDFGEWEERTLLLRNVKYDGLVYEFNLVELTYTIYPEINRLYLRDDSNNNVYYSLTVSNGKLTLEEHSTWDIL